MVNRLKCTEEQFLRDIAGHQIKIVSDSGIHRHIVFENPENSNCWFELITWPRTLCINGDCGSYVFSRLPDMFGFFREPDIQRGLYINPHYWGEKLQAIDIRSGFVEFDSDAFGERVKEHYDAFIESFRDFAQKDELWESISDDVLYYADSEHEAYRAVTDFDYEFAGGCFRFLDFFDSGGTETYTARYLWCLYAIVWGIQRYDAVKKI